MAQKGCPIAKTLTSISKKWALMILHSLHSNGTSRFTDLLRRSTGINPRILSRRLKELERMGLVSKKKINQAPPRVDYALTAKGHELIACFTYLDKWVKKFGK